MLRRDFLLNLFSGVMALLLGLGRKLPAAQNPRPKFPLDSATRQLFGVNWLVTNTVEEGVQVHETYYFADPEFLHGEHELTQQTYLVPREPGPALDLGFLQNHQPATMRDAVVDVRAVLGAAGRKLSLADQAMLRTAVSPDIATYETDEEVLQRLSSPAIGWHGEQVQSFRNEWNGEWLPELPPNKFIRGPRYRVSFPSYDPVPDFKVRDAQQLSSFEDLRQLVENGRPPLRNHTWVGSTTANLSAISRADFT